MGGRLNLNKPVVKTRGNERRTETRETTQAKENAEYVVEWTQICRYRIDKYRSRHRYAELLMLLEMYRVLSLIVCLITNPEWAAFPGPHLVGVGKVPFGASGAHLPNMGSQKWALLLGLVALCGWNKLMKQLPPNGSIKHACCSHWGRAQLANMHLFFRSGLLVLTLCSSLCGTFEKKH